MPKSQTPANDATNCSPLHSPRSDTAGEYTEKEILSKRLPETGLLGEKATGNGRSDWQRHQGCAVRSGSH